ncbi:alpha/beta hydrolase [Candidatus Roizmanbacteria bacterium]|nr:alpha/beta hydrolase [Candidatus Roizmanbacteria bacterium]
MLKTTKSYINIGDHDLYYEITGNGIAIIFAHGMGGNYLSWWQQIPYFSQNYQCITFSHQSYFPSKQISNTVDTNEFSKDLSELIDHLKLKKVILVGQSMGGWTVVKYALQFPSQIRSIILASTTGPFTDLSIEDLMKDFLKTGRAEYIYRNIHPAAGKRMTDEQPALHFLFQEIDALNIHVNKDKIKSALINSRNIPVEQFAKLHIPTLFISGEEDVVVNPKAIFLLAKLIPNSKFRSIPKTGHSVYFERAKLFNSFVKDFLKNEKID